MLGAELQNVSSVLMLCDEMSQGLVKDHFRNKILAGNWFLVCTVQNILFYLSGVTSRNDTPFFIFPFSRIDL